MLEEYNAQTYEYNGKKMTEYEATQKQREIERNIRRWKRENKAMEAAGLDTTESAVKIREWQEKEKDFLRQTGLKRQSARSQVGTYGRSEAGKVNAAAKKAQENANSIFNLGFSEANLRKYLKEKPVIDLLDNYGIKYIHRISAAEIIVDAGKPKITSMREHAIENLLTKPDRINMTLEQAQAFVDNSKLTLYQQDNNTLKFMAQEGYAVLNFKHELVTAVPQKWRKSTINIFREKII